MTDNETQPDAVRTADTAPPRDPARWARRSAVLALLLIACVVAAGYFIARHFAERQQAQQQRVDAIDTAIDALRLRQDDLATRGARLEHDIVASAAELAQVEQLLEHAAQQRTEPADAERLLRMANDSLQLQADVDTALRALKSADERLRALRDPRYAEVRRQLAQEMVALEAVPRPDVAGMAYTLSSLQSELAALPLRRIAAPQRNDHPPMQGDAEEAPRWRALLHEMWATLKGLVVIRRREAHDAPLVAPGEQLFLSQNLYLKLESARLALFVHDDRGFHASLDIARGWLREYYDTTAATAVATRLDALDEVDIAPPLPDISSSLTALRAVLTHTGDDGHDSMARPERKVPAGGSP